MKLTKCNISKTHNLHEICKDCDEPLVKENELAYSNRK
tara:strand:- start:145 stop:258 length:114 start_codon:yes stop_codon:yes gene_type:complete